MKKRNILSLLYQMASPLLLIVLGVILLFNPDFASIFLSRLIGWAATLAIVVYAIYTFLNWPEKGVVRSVILFVCFSVCHLLLNSPLLLAKNIGRFVGILIAIRGIRDVFQSRSRGHGQKLAMITAAVGIVLTVLPMTASRLVFSVCGAVILVIGIAMLIDRLKDRRYLEDGGDHNIIDAL